MQEFSPLPNENWIEADFVNEEQDLMQGLVNLSWKWPEVLGCTSFINAI